MELEICGAIVYTNNTQHISDKSKVKIYTGLIGGKKSKTCSIQIESESDDDSKDAWVGFDINRNTAKYLIGFLKSFIKESGKVNPDETD